MSILARCGHCGQTIRSPDGFAGKKTRCPKCRGVLHIPARAPEPELPDDDELWGDGAPEEKVERAHRERPRSRAVEERHRATPRIDPRIEKRSAAGVNRALAGTRPWVLFLAILGLAAAALEVLAILAIGGGIAAVSKDPAASGAGFLTAIVAFGPGATVTGVLSWFLLGYARGIRDHVKLGRAGALERALVAQRNFWMVAGILAAIAVALGAILVLAALSQARA